MQPPVAPRVPHARTVHGDTVVDDYAWMADRDDPRLLDYLRAENAYAAHRTAHVQPLVERIVGEIRSRTVETDLTVPVRHGGWWYYTRTVEGSSYPIHARVAVADSPARPVLEDDRPTAHERVLLDENAEADGGDFFALGALETSPDGWLLAWSVDRQGDEVHDLVVRDLRTDDVVDDAVRRIGAGLAWSLDGTQVFYLRLDDSFRAHEVWRHRVGRPAAEDVLVLAEPDERFHLTIGATKDDRWIGIGASSPTTGQVWLVDAADPVAEPVPVTPRRAGVLVDAEPCGSSILLLHNARRSNFEVVALPRAGAPQSEWVPLPWSTPDEFVTGLDVFDRFVALTLRRDGRPGVRIVPRDGDGFGCPRDVAIPAGPSGGEGTLTLGATPDPASPTVQVAHESLASPPSIHDYDVATGEVTLLRSRPVPGVDLGRLRETRLWATAPDGVRVPVSVVHDVDVRPDGSAPGVLYGYGAYGVCSDPWFSVSRLSVLERGVVVAVAHVRGGSELGWDWYEHGRMAAKDNSFSDLIAAADALVAAGWVDPRRLAAEGASAGGALVAASANRRPDRFRAVLAEVPFVDVLTTLLDPDLPLTVTEWEEWGDPVGDPAAYARIKGWSPYDNVPAGDFPAVVVTASVHDTRVRVTEPAKWVARLRDRVTDDPARPVLLRTELSAGHAGVSGRYAAWREIAWVWAVLLDLLGVPDPPA